jgi:large subunit ribosomal protein L25
MHQVPLSAKIKTGTGKGVNRKLRTAGQIPAVLYGKGLEAVSLQLDNKELVKAMAHGTNVIVALKISDNGGKGQDHLAMITAVQRDVFQKKLFHVDFQKISLDVMVEATVPLHFNGPAIGEKAGGMVEHPRRDLQVRALPMALPEQIEVDITGLDLEQSLHVKDLQVPDGVEVLTDGEELVVIVHITRAMEEASVPAPEAAVAVAGETKPAAT